MKVDLLNIYYIAAFLMGALAFASLLVKSQRPGYANQALAVFLLLNFAPMLEGYALNGYLPGLDVHLLCLIETAPPFLFGPLIYLWLRESITPSGNIMVFLRHASVHFVLFFTMMGALSFDLITDSFEYLYFRALLVVHVLAYVCWCLFKLWRHQQSLTKNYADFPLFRILPGFAVLSGFVAIWVITALNLFLLPHPDFLDFSIHQLFALQCGYTLIVSIVLVLGPDLYAPSQMSPQPETLKVETTDEVIQAKTERMPESVGHQISSELEQLMVDQRVYLDPEISLPALARKLDISAHNLSEVINQVNGKNFYEYINTHRVNHAKSMLVDGARSQLKINHIWSTSGFNNRTSFNTAFKKLTGETPSAFRKRIATH